MPQSWSLHSSAFAVEENESNKNLKFCSRKTKSISEGLVPRKVWGVLCRAVVQWVGESVAPFFSPHDAVAASGGKEQPQGLPGRHCVRRAYSRPWLGWHECVTRLFFFLPLFFFSGFGSARKVGEGRRRGRGGDGQGKERGEGRGGERRGEERGGEERRGEKKDQPVSIN